MTNKVLIVVAVLLAAGGFYVASSSKQEASKQVKAIVAADLLAQDVAPQLKTLKDYVAGHMGAGATITLSGAYQRAQAAAQAAASVQNSNSQIYAQAQAACAGKSDSITQAKCNQDFLASHLQNVPPPVAVPQPKLADYQYQYRAPLWTADTAGLLFLGSIAALAALLIGLRKRTR